MRFVISISHSVINTNSYNLFGDFWHFGLPIFSRILSNMLFFVAWLSTTFLSLHLTYHHLLYSVLSYLLHPSSMSSGTFPFFHLTNHHQSMYLVLPTLLFTLSFGTFHLFVSKTSFLNQTILYNLLVHFIFLNLQTTKIMKLSFVTIKVMTCLFYIGLLYVFWPLSSLSH